MSAILPPLTGAPPAPDANLPWDRNIGSLWRRILAFLVDAIIVGVAGSLIAFPFFDAFSRLGSWGRLVGLCMALPYFAILDSKLGNGQTLGKRLLHLQVVDRDGNAISFGKSVVRYLLFFVPYYLDGLVLPVTRTSWAVSSVFSLIIFGLGGATFYLMLFNVPGKEFLIW